MHSHSIFGIIFGINRLHKKQTMKKLSGLILIITLSIAAHSCSFAQTSEIKWMTLQEAESAMKKKPKKMFIDIYTDWCGWCKRLDATTYKDQAVVDYITKNFYAVKLNAETKDPITYLGKEYTYDVSRKLNMVSAQFMEASSGYPTLTFVDEKFTVLTVNPGYVEAPMFLKTLKYYGDNYYLNMDVNTYLTTVAK